MDIAIIITLVCLAFGAGTWFYKIQTRLNDLDRQIKPLILLHKEELVKYFVEKGIIEAV
jgi:tRNA(Ile)-lysidine synthase TilS/MesJ